MSIRTPTIMLSTGREFNFIDLERNEVSVNEIAHALSMLCRYGGHCSRFYSVAEHSVLVSTVCGDPWAGLLHDAAEAFLGDVCSPLKRLLPDYRALEERVEEWLFARLGVGWPLSESVKEADYAVAAAEVNALMAVGWDRPDGPFAWMRERGVTPARVEVFGAEPRVAEALFMGRYEALRRDRVGKVI